MATRTFRLIEGITAESICDSTTDFLRNMKGMIAESGPTQDGWFVQAKEQADGWKTISGMTKAIQVHIVDAGENVIVNCDFGKWSDKIGAGALGMFVFAPLAVTAGIGAWQQKKLPDEIYAHIERFIMYGGANNNRSASNRISPEEITCPACKKTNSKGTRFCKHCGAAAGKQCASCGTQTELSTKFCPNCGTNMETRIKTCTGCGAELPPESKFCSKCGTKSEG